MFFTTVSLFAVTVLCFSLVEVYAESGDTAFLHPQYPVKKIGDNIEFKCRSPRNYTGIVYESVKFELEHDGRVISDNPEYHYLIEMIYSARKFLKAIASKQDAGIYTCIITPSDNGKVVRVTTELYVVEGNEKTQLVELGEKPKMSCLSSRDELNVPIVTVVNVDGENLNGSVISETVKEDAFKTYICLVTTKKAMDNYRSIKNAVQKGAVAEINMTLSVVEAIDCEDRTSCALEAWVYGETPVNISWLVDEELRSPELEVGKNVTKSKTSLLNLTTTTPIELRVSAGHDNIWRKNLTWPQVKDDRTYSDYWNERLPVTEKSCELDLPLDYSVEYFGVNLGQTPEGKLRGITDTSTWTAENGRRTYAKEDTLGKYTTTKNAKDNYQNIKNATEKGAVGENDMTLSGMVLIIVSVIASVYTELIALLTDFKNFARIKLVKFFYQLFKSKMLKVRTSVFQEHLKSKMWKNIPNVLQNTRPVNRRYPTRERRKPDFYGNNICQ